MGKREEGGHGLVGMGSGVRRLGSSYGAVAKFSMISYTILAPFITFQF